MAKRFDWEKSNLRFRVIGEAYHATPAEIEAEKKLEYESLRSEYRKALEAGDMGLAQSIEFDCHCHGFHVRILYDIASKFNHKIKKKGLPKWAK